jgi:hypothetical protein
MTTKLPSALLLPAVLRCNEGLGVAFATVEGAEAMAPSRDWTESAGLKRAVAC